MLITYYFFLNTKHADQVFFEGLELCSIFKLDKKVKFDSLAKFINSETLKCLT